MKCLPKASHENTPPIPQAQSARLGPNRRFIVDYQHDDEDHLVTGYFVDLPKAWNRKSKK